MAIDWKRGDNLKEACKLCGGILVIRQSSRDGGLFVGCRSFPSCRFNRPIRPGDEREGGQWGEESGYLCAECQQPQYNTPSGISCKNGHGGAGSIDPTTGEVVDRGFDDLMPDGLDDEDEDRDPFAVNGGPEPAQTMELAAVDPDIELEATGGCGSFTAGMVAHGSPTAGIMPTPDGRRDVRDVNPDRSEAVDHNFCDAYGGEKQEGEPPTDVPSFEETYETADHMLVFTVELRRIDSRKVESSAEATFAFDVDATKRRMAAGTDSPVEIVGKMLTYLVRSVKAVLLK